MPKTARDHKRMLTLLDQYGTLGVPKRVEGHALKTQE
jgi:hypothetical protein